MKLRVTLNLSANLIGNSNYEINFPNKILLTDTKVSKNLKDFANGLSANIKFAKTQLSKIVQFGVFLFSPPIIPIKEITSLANSITNPF